MRVRFVLPAAVVLVVAAGVGVAVVSDGHHRPASSPPRPGIAVAGPVGSYADLCGGAGAACSPGSVPAALRRPLRLPTVSAGRCPVAPRSGVSFGVGAARGPGPVYPVIAAQAGTVLVEHSPRPGFAGFAGSSFGGAMVLWAVAASYQGPVLIRGGQLDGGNPLRFSLAAGRLLTELQFPPDRAAAPGRRADVRYWFLYTRLRAPGCYAWQVDGSTFSYPLAFRAVVR